MLCFFCSSGFLNAFGVLLQYYATHQLRDRSVFAISWIGSLGSFLLFLFAAPAGLLVDKFGPKVDTALRLQTED
jgi:hypothetical protein